MTSFNIEYLFQIIYDCFTNTCGSIDAQRLFEIWYILKLVIIALIALFILALIYAGLEQQKINKKFSAQAHLPVTVVGGGKTNDRWNRILARVKSPNPGEWRLAILEADSVMDEILTAMELHQTGVRQKLDLLNRNECQTLDQAYEAHAIRDQVALDPNFVLTQAEAERVIGLYEQFFKEFQFI